MQSRKCHNYNTICQILIGSKWSDGFTCKMNILSVSTLTTAYKNLINKFIDKDLIWLNARKPSVKVTKVCEGNLGKWIIVFTPHLHAFDRQS